MRAAPSQQGVHIRLPGMRPIHEIAARHPHGHRMRYVAGCRCEDCRAANSAREREYDLRRKAGESNPIVSADLARAHILALAEAGVGLASVVAATDISRAILCKIKAGSRKGVRRANEAKILTVPLDFLADGALVDAGPTWRLIGEMVAAGITKLRIGKELHGAKARGLQLSKNLVTVRNAERVKRLHAELMESDALVDGARTAKLIADMLEDQLGNRRRVAESIGCTQADLQGKFKRVRKAFALAVEDAHRRMSE